MARCLEFEGDALWLLLINITVDCQTFFGNIMGECL